MRLVADKLEVEPNTLHSMLDAATAAEPRVRLDRSAVPSQNGNGAAPSVEAVARMEREFLTACLADSVNGREYLGRLEDDHFSSGALRRVRDHLIQHFEDPLAELPEDDPALAALVTDVAMRGQEQHASAEALRLNFLQLELQRVERQLRHAARDVELERQRELWPVRESLRLQIDELMGRDL
jgi:hypothetical protein